MLLTAVKSPKRLVRPYITTLVARFFVFGYGSWKSAEEVSCVFMEESLLFSSSRVKGYFISETFFKLLLNVPIDFLEEWFDLNRSVIKKNGDLATPYSLGMTSSK